MSKAIPRIRQKKDSGHGNTWETKQGRMDCVDRDMRAIGKKKDEVHDITGWRRIERLEEEEVN